ncbi:hypothetical protein JXI42_11630 [bacterium]|nr:hypothetical protein [bacterium]
MYFRLELLLNAAFILFLLIYPLHAEEVEDTTIHNIIEREYIPYDSTSGIWSIGTGYGIHYAAYGFKFALGTNHLSGEASLGILDYSRTFAYSVSAVATFRNRYAAFRPRISITASSCILQFLITDEYDYTYTPIYEAVFPGIAASAGFEWRFIKTFPLNLHFSFGYGYPFKGYIEVENKIKDKTDYYENSGIIYTDKSKFPPQYYRFSVGLVLSPRTFFKEINK